MREFYFKHIKPNVPAVIHNLLYRVAVKQQQNRREVLRKQIVGYYEGQSASPYKADAINFLKENKFSFIPYSWTQDYLEKPVKIYRENSMCYVVMDKEKKLFFKRDMDGFAVSKLFRELSMEQDVRSPHLYAGEGHIVSKGSIVADVGAAEGYFSLSAAEEAEKLFLFESDPEWIRALEATFREYSHKVEIINMFVSNQDDNGHISLDKYFGNGEITFLKADIEGGEPEMLLGAAQLLSEKRIKKASICTYHHPSHAEEFSRLLEGYGYTVKAVPGFIPHWQPPHLLTGVLWADS